MTTGLSSYSTKSGQSARPTVRWLGVSDVWGAIAFLLEVYVCLDVYLRGAWCAEFSPGTG